MISGTFTKASSSAQTGICVGERRGKVVVSNVIPGSLAAQNIPQLRRGLEIASINGTSVQGMSSAGAAQLLIEAVGNVTINCVDPQSDTLQC